MGAGPPWTPGRRARAAVMRWERWTMLVLFSVCVGFLGGMVWWFKGEVGLRSNEDRVRQAYYLCYLVRTGIWRDIIPTPLILSSVFVSDSTPHYLAPAPLRRWNMASTSTQVPSHINGYTKDQGMRSTQRLRRQSRQEQDVVSSISSQPLNFIPIRYQECSTGSPILVFTKVELRASIALT